jgi:hypothetical protein
VTLLVKSALNALVIIAIAGSPEKVWGHPAYDTFDVENVILVPQTHIFCSKAVTGYPQSN